MNYILLAIVLLILFLLIVSFWFENSNTKFLYLHVKKNREVNQHLVDSLLKSNQKTIDCQKNLDANVDELMKLVDAQNASLHAYLNMFTAIAQSDVLSARRDELIRTKELKIALERIISMTTMSRQDPSAIDKLAIESVTNRIEELENILNSSKEKVGDIIS